MHHLHLSILLIIIIILSIVLFEVELSATCIQSYLITLKIFVIPSRMFSGFSDRTKVNNLP
jgi:hypothetical protein